MNTSEKIILSAVLCCLGIWLLQRPSCSRGCKTIAEHLLTDGLDEMVAAIFV